VRKRNYKAEYARRMASAKARGLSGPQGRGHSRAGEVALRTSRELTEKEIAALRAFRESRSAAKAAKSAGMSPERFRRFLRAEGVAERRGRKWTVTDNLFRETDIISGGRRYPIRVRGFEPASRIAQHKAAVRTFLALPDTVLLEPFQGEAVTDVTGRQHVFETNPNTLLRLMSTGGESFEAVYRIVV